MPVVVLASTALALSLAVYVVYLLAKREVITLNGQSQGILFILVVGSATDYALLLVSRYREELRRYPSRWPAMRVAYRASIEPIAATAGTVVLALLCLLLSDLNSNRGLGPVAAIGIAASLVATLTFLPAALVLLGRAAFWPFRPKVGSAGPESTGIWARVSALVGSRPRLIWALTSIVLLVGVAFVPQLKADGVAAVGPVHRQELGGLRARPAGTRAALRGRHRFPGGDHHQGRRGGAGRRSRPRGGRDRARRRDAHCERAGGDRRGAGRLAGQRGRGGHRAAAAGRGARDPGRRRQVGGLTASALDVQTTAKRDLRVIIPVVLAVVFLVLALLLRALVAPIMLIATVVLSFAATLGVAAVVFNHVFGFPGADPSLPLFAFVFLVALGIDYNIFLMTRVREEVARHGHREGALRGSR